jgi:hypothetical protein
VKQKIIRLSIGTADVSIARAPRPKVATSQDRLGCGPQLLHRTGNRTRTALVTHKPTQNCSITSSAWISNAGGPVAHVAFLLWDGWGIVWHRRLQKVTAVRRRLAFEGRNPTLGEVVAQSYVLAYRENVDSLVAALEAEMLNPTVLRAVYSKEEETYSRTVRTFMNHLTAWRRAAQHEGYTLICEADFVPCMGLASFPTFWPSDDPLAWGYLYQGSPRLLGLIGAEKYLRGHAAPLVAYVVNARVAAILCTCFDADMAGRDPRDFFSFDGALQWSAMGRGCRAFITMKHYGEHGGLANPEHGQHGVRRAGQHRADNLAGPLHFLPQYCDGSRLTYAFVRVKERLYGLARLATNRWMFRTHAYPFGISDRLEMAAVGLKRLLF